MLLETFRPEYNVRQARTAAAAGQALAREAPAAVILDYRLPDKTGLDVLRDLREKHPALPVIMMTAYGSESVCQSAFRLGVADYFAKPMSIFALAAAVKKAVGGTRARRAASEHQPHHVAEERSPVGGTDLAVQRVVMLIRQRYADRLSLVRLARRYGTSTCGLSRRFSRTMGVSFRRYLIDTRLERAKHLLVSGPSSITDIAHTVGFSDLARFDKLFRNRMGVSPSQYRLASQRSLQSTA